MLVEFSLYNINTNLLAVFSFLFEFPVSERAQSSLDLLVITLWPITGLDLQLLLMVVPGNPSDTPVLGNVTWRQPNQFNVVVSCSSDCPPRSDVVFPGAGDHGIPPRRLRVLAVSLETPGHLQTGSGSICVRAPPELLHHGHSAVGVVPEAPAGRLHRFLPPGQTESDIHSHECLAAVRTGAQGEI